MGVFILADVRLHREGLAQALHDFDTLEVVGLADQGLCNKEIATRLGVEVSTVKNHIHHLLEKLRAKRRGKAAARARRALLGFHPGGSASVTGLFTVLGTLTYLASACNDPIPPLPCTTTVGDRCWVNLGPGEVVGAVAEVSGQLWIGTASRGILRYDPSARAWREVAFRGRAVRSIVTVGSGAAIWAAVSGGDSDDTSRACTA